MLIPILVHHFWGEQIKAHMEMLMCWIRFRWFTKIYTNEHDIITTQHTYNQNQTKKTPNNSTNYKWEQNIHNNECIHHSIKWGLNIYMHMKLAKYYMQMNIAKYVGTIGIDFPWLPSESESEWCRHEPLWFSWIWTFIAELLVDDTGPLVRAPKK